MTQYKRVIVFGDSLQDSGNLFKHTQFPLDPFYKGRFCNGKVAPEFLNEMISAKQAHTTTLHNFSIGGALTSGKNPKAILKPYAFSVANQVDRFMNELGRFNREDFVMVDGGGNNFLFALHDEMPYFNISAVYRVARDLEETVERLIKLGATSIMLWNVPDVTATPAFSKSPFPKWVSKPLATFLKHQIKRQNRKIDAIVPTFKDKYPHVRVEVFDVYHLLQTVLESPVAYGFEDAHEPCVQSFGGVDAKGNIQTNLTIDNNPDTHLFWDFVHPTAKGQKMLAEHILNHWYQL